MEILFLGTSSMVPTKDRNQSGVLISYRNDKILVDCGEGIQRQLKIAGVSLVKITKILISHLHGDHVLGLPGLIQSMSAAGYGKTLPIYGPVGTKKFMKKMFEVFVFDRKINVEVVEVTKGNFFEGSGFVLGAELLDHNIKTLGYSLTEKDKRRINLKYIKKMKIPVGPLLGKLQEGKSIIWKGGKIKVDKSTFVVRGKKIVIINDTVPCRGANILAKNSDLLICESTYTSDLGGKGKKYKHMTAKQAAELAKRSKTKKLVLTHFSARYTNTRALEKDAKTSFRNVLAANDFLKIKL